MVLSRPDRLAEIGHEDVERAVGVKVKHTFPGDYRRALDALNKGARSPSRTTPSSPVRWSVWHARWPAWKSRWRRIKRQRGSPCSEAGNQLSQEPKHVSSSFTMIPTTSDFRGLPKQSADIRNPQYQALKGRIHEELLGRLNLERLARVKREC